MGLRLVVRELLRPRDNTSPADSLASDPRTSLATVVRSVLAPASDRTPGEPDETKILMTVREVADALRIGRARCYELIRLGEIPSVRLGRSVRVPVAQLRARIDLLAASEEQEMLDIDLPGAIRSSDRSDFSRPPVR